MKTRYLQIFFLLLALLAAGVELHWAMGNAVELGRLPLWQRTLIVEFGAGLLFVSTVLLCSLLGLRRWVVACAGLLLLVPPAYFLMILPRSATGGVAAQQLDSALITESTSNGIIEVGFAYPIYTPTLQVTNNGLFTASYEVYLRMSDGNGDTMLFRAVRKILPDNSLSVEATVNGMLSENSAYLFNPLEVAPRQTVSGQLVFIISNLRDGTAFNDAINSAYPGEFELRDPKSGSLLLSFPLTRI